MIDYLSDETIPEDLRETIKMFLKAKKERPFSADLYSDEIRSLAHNYSGNRISEEKAENIIATYSM